MTQTMTAADVAVAYAGLTMADLFDPNDPDVAFSKFINVADGTLSNGNTYNVTGFIPVVQGATYTAGGPTNAQRRAYFDSNKQFVAGVFDSSATAFAIPVDGRTAFMRMSAPVTAWDNLKIQRASGLLNYTAYLNRPPRDDVDLWRLRQTTSRLAGLAFGEGGQLIVNIAGDSYMHGAGTTPRIAKYLAAKFGDAGGGWCGFGSLASGNAAPWTLANQPSYLNGNARPTTYPTRAFGNGSMTYYTAGSPDLAMQTLTQSGDYVVQAFPAAPVHNGSDLLFVGTPNGQVRYSWGTYNSGAVADPASYTFGSTTTINVQGTVGATQIADIKAGMPSGAGMLKIEWVAGTANLCGVNLKSAADGVRVNKIAATGSNVGGWATGTASTGFLAGLQAIGGDLFTYMDGPNSEGGIDAVSWVNNLGTVFNRIKAVLPATDYLQLMPPENARGTNAFPIAAYTVMARNLANSLRFALKVVRFGDAGNIAEYKSTGVVPLLNADDLHPSNPAVGTQPSGAILLAMRWLDAVIPPGLV